MDALFPATRLVRIKNAGHWVHSEQPEVFLETLRRFLGRQSRAERRSGPSVVRPTPDVDSDELRSTLKHSA